jgi:hypothetical protein
MGTRLSGYAFTVALNTSIHLFFQYCNLSVASGGDDNSYVIFRFLQFHELLTIQSDFLMLKLLAFIQLSFLDPFILKAEPSRFHLQL